VNKDDLRTILSYLNKCGLQAQRLYYVYNDTELVNDNQYDAMLQLCRELFDKYPDLSPHKCCQFTEVVGK
jgi:N-acetyl-anhydromuramyl-L-alanine amidase AmpD